MNIASITENYYTVSDVISLFKGLRIVYFWYAVRRAELNAECQLTLILIFALCLCPLV